jgi:medium-chain acyl-[acyl-carrier-protein] hydrolase
LNRSSHWLKCRPANAHPQLRLFCLPHAGGGATAFHSWNDALPASVQVCSVLLPGRETRLSEPLYSRMEPLVEAMARELGSWQDIPYVVFGHSMGALLAFEWVRRLQREKHSMPAWLFLSGRRAPDLASDMNLLHSLSDAEFVAELTRLYKGIPDEFLLNAEFMEVLLPILRADIAMVESYRFHEGEPLDCPITVLAGSQDASVNWDQLLAWNRQTRGPFKVQILPGGHFYPHGPLLQAISATLAELHL